MPLGISFGFGKKKQKSSGTATLDKLETSLQSGLESTASTSTGSETTSQSATSSSQGTSTTGGSTSQNTSSTGTQTQTGTSRTLSQSVQSALESALTGLIGRSDASAQTVADSAASLTDFDPNQFVSGVVAGAESRINEGLDSSLGQLFSRIGGTDGSNTMASILANRARSNAASELAGIESQAAATAAQIQQGNVGTTAQALNANQGLIPALASVLKGAEVTTESSTLQQELANILGTQQATTQVAENSQQNQNVATQKVQELLQLVAQAMQSSTQTNATETQKTKGSSSGFNFGLTAGQKG